MTLAGTSAQEGPGEEHERGHRDRVREQGAGEDDERRRDRAERGREQAGIRVEKIPAEEVDAQEGERGGERVDEPGRAGEHAEREDEREAGRVLAEPQAFAHDHERDEERIARGRGRGRNSPAGEDLRLEVIGVLVLEVGHRLEHVERDRGGGYEGGEAQHGDLERPAAEKGRRYGARRSGAGTVGGRHGECRVGLHGCRNNIRERGMLF